MQQPTSGPQFSSLPLSPASLANLAKLGYDSMTPVQAASLPLGLAGHDLIVQAKTGSGKTAAFGLVLLSKLDLSKLSVQALVLCPTRELTDQVAQELRCLARTECGKALAGAESEAMLYFSRTSRRRLHSLAWDGIADSMGSIVHGKRTRPA